VTKIEELEARLKALEARPVYVPYPVYLTQYVPAPPPYWNTWHQPNLYYQGSWCGNSLGAQAGTSNIQQQAQAYGQLAYGGCSAGRGGSNFA
jgi:hypothetical protein